MVLSKVAVSQKLSWKHLLPILYSAAKDNSLHSLAAGLSLHWGLPNELGSFMVPSLNSVGSCFCLFSPWFPASTFLPLNFCSGKHWYYFCGLDLEGCLGPLSHPLLFSPKGKPLMG